MERGGPEHPRVPRCGGPAFALLTTLRVHHAVGGAGRRAPGGNGKGGPALVGGGGGGRGVGRDRRVMESGEAQTAEDHLTAAGVTRTYLATKAPYRDGRGEVIGIVGISRDITYRKKA